MLITLEAALSIILSYFNPDPEFVPRIVSQRNQTKSEMNFYLDHRFGQLEWNTVKNGNSVTFNGRVGIACVLNARVYEDLIGHAYGRTAAEIICSSHKNPSDVKEVIIFNNPDYNNFNLTEITLVYCVCRIEAPFVGILSTKEFFIAKRLNKSHYYHFEEQDPIDDVTYAYKVKHDFEFSPSMVNRYNEVLQLTNP